MMQTKGCASWYRPPLPDLASHTNNVDDSRTASPKRAHICFITLASLADRVGRGTGHPHAIAENHLYKDQLVLLPPKV